MARVKLEQAQMWCAIVASVATSLCSVSAVAPPLSSPNTSKVSFCMTAPLLLPLSVEAIQPREASFEINEQAGRALGGWLIDRVDRVSDLRRKERATWQRQADGGVSGSEIGESHCDCTLIAAVVEGSRAILLYLSRLRAAPVPAGRL